MPNEKKCVIVANENMPMGLLVNTAALLGISLGQKFPELVGQDVADASGQVHPGLIIIPLPILKGDASRLRSLREQVSAMDDDELYMVDFSDVAQSCLTYPDYMEKSDATREEHYTYLGLAIYGDKKKVNKLTGSLPLLR